MEKIMSLEEKLNFIKSLKSGDFFYSTIRIDCEEYSYVSVFNSIEELDTLFKINEFATMLYSGNILDMEKLGKLYYNTHCTLWKNDNTFGQISFLRTANHMEKRYFKKNLKISYGMFAFNHRLDEIPLCLTKMVQK